MELSLSPFHIGKLLDAPILRGINSAAGGLGVINEFGKTRLKLGGIMFDGCEDEDRFQAVPRTRIGIGIDQPGQVFQPHSGARTTD